MKTPHEIIFERNQYYADLYKGGVQLFILMPIVMALAITTTLSVIYRAPDAHFIALRPNRAPIPPIPVSQPYVSDEQAVAWVTDAIQDAFDLSYKTLGADLTRVQGQYFTGQGADRYWKALEAIDLPNTLVQKEMTLRFEINGPTELVSSQVNPNFQVYQWIARIHGELIMDSPNGSIRHPWKLEVVFGRSSLLADLVPLRISRFNAM